MITDNHNQLTQANYNYLSGSTWTNSSEFDLTGLAYDKNGNITSLSRRYEGLKTYSYTYTSGTNRLAAVNKSGTNISFGYDGNGNIKTIGTGYSITNTVYDWRNLPTSITKSGTSYGYRYDLAGLRVYKQEGDNIHTLRVAFGEVLATYKNGSLDYWNIIKPDGAVIGRREGSTRLYYHRDHLGSTRAVVDASGSVVQTYDYYPFGLEMPGRSLTSGSTARERFTGHERDEEVGLDYMQARRYAAEFGRFLSVDPLADEYPGWSPYVYALNNTLRFNDPTGLCPEDGSAGENQFGPGLCMEAVVVTATRLPATRPLSITSFVTFAIPTARVGGQALVRSPNPYAIGAGIILLGGAIVADHFIDTPAQRMMQANSESDTFDDIWDSARPTDNPDIRQKDGGFEQAEKDFEALNPSGGAPIPGLGKWGDLPNGKRVVVRKRSTRDGRPTLDRHSNSGNVEKKIRYNNN